jgi:hypothetical protein
MAKSAISRLSTFLSWDLDRLSVNATSLPPKTLDRFAAVGRKSHRVGRRFWRIFSVSPRDSRGLLAAHIVCTGCLVRFEKYPRN